MRRLVSLLSSIRRPEPWVSGQYSVTVFLKTVTLENILYIGTKLLEHENESATVRTFLFHGTIVKERDNLGTFIRVLAVSHIKVQVNDCVELLNFDSREGALESIECSVYGILPARESIEQDSKGGKQKREYKLDDSCDEQYKV